MYMYASLFSNHTLTDQFRYDYTLYMQIMDACM